MPLVLDPCDLIGVVVADGQRHFKEGRRESTLPHPQLTLVVILPFPVPSYELHKWLCNSLHLSLSARGERMRSSVSALIVFGLSSPDTFQLSHPDSQLVSTKSRTQRCLRSFAVTYVICLSKHRQLQLQSALIWTSWALSFGTYPHDYAEMAQSTAVNTTGIRRQRLEMV